MVQVPQCMAMHRPNFYPTSLTLHLLVNGIRVVDLVVGVCVCVSVNQQPGSKLRAITCERYIF